LSKVLETYMFGEVVDGKPFDFSDLLVIRQCYCKVFVEISVENVGSERKTKRRLGDSEYSDVPREYRYHYFGW
jgi:hypothetical protein